MLFLSLENSSNKYAVKKINKRTVNLTKIIITLMKIQIYILL